MDMTSSLRFIDAQTARTHGWQQVTDYKFALQMPAIAVQISELGALISTVPLAFAKLGPDYFALVAVMGFADGRNQLVDDEGRWCVTHQPVDLKCYPFSVQPFTQTDQGASTYGLCFNHASGLYRETPDETLGQQRFFSDDGAPQPWIKEITELLQHNLVQQQRTQRAVKALQDAGLIVPWQLELPAGTPQDLLPKGLYRVDEAKLNKLKGDALEPLHAVHAIALAYAQLLSMSRLAVIKRLKDAHAKKQHKHPSPAGSSTPDPAIVTRLFDPGESDTIKFNW